MKKFYKAFTLTELLVALGVIAILCAILLPLIFSIMPNQNTIMAKRAYYALQTIISEMINDEVCYPDKTLATDDEKRLGFDDGYGYANCTAWSSNIDSEGDADKKFTTIFNDKLAKNGSITWNIDASSFKNSKNSTTAYAKFVIDVNGDGKPDKGCSTAAGGSGTCLDGNDYDKFAVKVYEDGKIEIDPTDTWAIEAIDINKNITD